MKLFNRLPALLVAALVALAPAAVLLVAPADAYAQATPPAAEQPAPAAAKPAPTPPAGAGEPAKETIENPYGLEALWKGGDFISKGTLIILVIMSMGSWYIMFVKVYEQWKLFRQAATVQKAFWGANSIPEGIEALRGGTPFRF